LGHRDEISDMAGIVHATDGSEYAKQAGHRAVELAAELGVPLHVLCVVDRREYGESALSTGELACIQAEDHGYETVSDVANRAEAADIEVLTEVRHGRPTDDIVEYADEIDADAIVIGEHGDHGVHLGGVGRRVQSATDRKTIVAPLQRR
jgi:nucleotide-binding universal stress UspA family protein